MQDYLVFIALTHFRHDHVDATPFHATDTTTDTVAWSRLLFRRTTNDATEYVQQRGVLCHSSATAIATGDISKFS